MKTRSFYRFFKRPSKPASPLSERSRSRGFFFTGFRCPSGQLQIVAMPLPFGQTGSASLLGEF
jgi:hypothetical protein